MNEIFRITVIMGIYNCADTLIEALESLEAQTYKKFRVILCDDGSTDNTLEIARKWGESHPNYIVINNECNMGLNATLNRCLKHADTEFVARMDGDDRSLPHRFEYEVKFLDENPDFAIVSGPMHYFDDNGVFRKGEGCGVVTKQDFIVGTPFCHAPCMVRREAYEKVGGYTVSSKLLRVEDYHLWFKMYAVGYKGYMLHTPIYEMRDDRNAVLRRTLKNRMNEAYVKHIGYKMIGLPWWTHIYCLVPIIKGFMPFWLYRYFHQQSMK
ncbi:glycosyltransferase family 2 protein [Bacteroides acidifaciens]|uniref:glycosyltransferase family 2 protein n=1 Tax=Bacteroides acidifaciens TaxID=85831 RepID=UPI001C3E7265|nr:glycosyltransferase [Bacteroides acidifaciens]MCR2004984.1 glycosyltransferase [Bacteroides acidifaciens]